MTGFGHAPPHVARLADGVSRVLAPNPSMMTGPGTNTYLFGRHAVAVVDPGPAIPEHLDAVEQAAAGPIRFILVTHTHPDHSPAAALLAERTGAQLLGRPAPDGPHQDATFVPARILADGEVLQTDEFQLEAIHTPGHASNHLCYRHVETNWLVTGDHVIEGSTVVIDPPDGNMADYIASLEKLKRLNCAALLPGHGERIDDPRRVIDWIVEHRLAREATVLAALTANPDSTGRELVAKVYTDVPAELHPLAERSLLAHLEKLGEEARASCAAGRWSAL
ncbi:MAG: MBL fold metallo-hydrolase [Pseudomonadota bacterium]